MGTRGYRFTRRQLGVATGATMVAACGSDDEGPSGSGGTGPGGAGGEGGGTSTGEPGPEPAEAWVPDGMQDEAAFVSGLRVGDAAASSAIIGGRTTEASVTARIAVGTESGWEEVAELADLVPADGVVEVEVDGLEADHAYSVAFFSADGTRRSSVSRFRSALAADQSRVIRFGSTSCLGGNEPWATLTHAAAEKLDFFTLLGDTIYADQGPNLFEYETKWQAANGVAGMRDLAASTSFIATWDDHEVDNNWSLSTPGIDQQVAEALTAYRRGMPQRLGPGGTQIWRKLSWGSAMDVFVLDGRGERMGGNYLSVEQMNWLKDELSASTARFKVILNSVPIIDFSDTVVGAIQADDRWQGFPAQRSEIVAHVAQIPGVLWVSGDFHIGGIAYIDGASGPGAAIPEVLTGPGGSPINPAAGLVQPDERFLSIIGTWSYTLFEADPAAGTVRVVFIADDASVLDEHVLQL